MIKEFLHEFLKDLRSTSPGKFLDSSIAHFILKNNKMVTVVKEVSKHLLKSAKENFVWYDRLIHNSPDILDKLLIADKLVHWVSISTSMSLYDNFIYLL